MTIDLRKGERASEENDSHLQLLVIHSDFELASFMKPSTMYTESWYIPKVGIVLNKRVKDQKKMSYVNAALAHAVQYTYNKYYAINIEYRIYTAIHILCFRIIFFDMSNFKIVQYWLCLYSTAVAL